MDSKKLVIGALIVVVVLGGLFYGIRKTQPLNTTPTPITETQQSISPETSPNSSTEASVSALSEKIKEFTVIGSNFKFEPATLTVNQGDKVRITFKNTQGMHNFVIDEFNAKSKTIQSGTEDVLEFTAAETGIFEYYCAVGNHRAMGMKGTLTVK